jgi:sec-independent protein translocase protein TatA
MDLGPTELIVILVIVLILFGGGRVAQLGSELGKGIREFRQGLSDEADPKKPDNPTSKS